MGERPIPPWAWVTAGAVLLVSVPAMWLIGQLAIFAYGLGLWILPWLVGAFIGGYLLPQGSHSFVPTEFDGPIIVFAFAAALQNALMFLLAVKAAIWARERGRLAEDGE